MVKNNAQCTFIGLSVNLEYKVESEYSDDRGKFVVLKCIIQDYPFLLVSISLKRLRGVRLFQHN